MDNTTTTEPIRCRHYDGCTSPAQVIIHQPVFFDPDFDHNLPRETYDTPLCLAHTPEFRAGLNDPDAFPEDD